MPSTLFALSVIPETTFPIDPDQDILSSNIVIARAMVSPGGGGVLRLYFSITFDVGIGDITIKVNDSEVGILNSDNNEQITSDGYYTFDIEVEANDEINLIFKGGTISTATEITAINFIRAHLIQFGA